jgi:uncharacterized membrane protein YbaN (DUF454 family)
MNHGSRNHLTPDTAAEGPRVVHSSLGRLRVHLPDPDGGVVARLRGLPGVTTATASQWTGNILIQFDTRQTSEMLLLAQLRSHCPTPSAVVEKSAAGIEESEVQPARPGGYVTGVWRRVYTIFGWSSVGMAFVGAATPGIPTAPFALLAGYFFIRSSPTAHEWLLRSRWFGSFVREWEEHHAVRRSVKYAAVGLMAAGLAISFLIGLPTVVLTAIVLLEIVGLVVVLRLPVVESFPPSTALAHQ